jgi:hypothetical protein
MEKMESVLSYIKNTRVELTLYTYDSFLFSYPVEDDTTHALKLKEILEEGGFPIKVSWGADYSRV